MQTSKFLFVIGAAALLAAPLPTFAGPDNEAQAKMREALRQKMEELNAPATPAPAPVVPPPVVVAPVKPKPAPTPVAAPAPVVRTPTVVVPVPLEPAATEVPVAVVPAPKSSSKFSEVAVTSDDEKAARMREALRQSMLTAPQPVPAPMVSAPAKPAAPGKTTSTAAAPVYSPPPTVNVEVPASPLTGSKQERLAELLRRYKADAITPMEYHNQRAKIIAEP